MLLHGDEQIAFNKVNPGNGFDAWKRVAVPISPRSDAQLRHMHKSVQKRPTSRKLVDGLADLDKWEGQLAAYYKCGGPTIPDGTNVLIVMGVLPSNTNSGMWLALKGLTFTRLSRTRSARTWDSWKIMAGRQEAARLT